MSSVDLFTGIHKAIRAMLFDLAQTVQTVDVEDPARRAALRQDIETLFGFLQEHGDSEDQLIFPLAAQDEPQLAAALDAEHHSHITLAERILAETAALESAADARERQAALAVLRRSVHDFTAGQLTHMNREEREMLPATQRVASDEQLRAVLGTILGGITIERHAAWMRWMLPSLTPQELDTLLRGLAAAPVERLAMVARVAAEVLPPDRQMILRENFPVNNAEAA